MNTNSDFYLDVLQQKGWAVERQPARLPFNADLLRRYDWVPPEVLDFLCETKIVNSPDQKAWLQTSTHFNGASGFAFAWNDWELLSLDAAHKDHDEGWASEIQAFWDTHFPIFMSVKSGYAYFALEKSSMRIVHGEEPEFEETMFLTNDFSDLLKMLAERDSRLTRWV